jgi:adenylate cyclase
MCIGPNSGLALAGVICRRYFLYDSWGDFVITASPIESQGNPEETQVTEATRDLLYGQLLFVDGGQVDIKGKGPMGTFLLQGVEHAEDEAI